MEVVQLGAFALNAGPVHWSDAAQLVVGVAAAAQTRLRQHVEKINIRRTRYMTRALLCSCSFPVPESRPCLLRAKWSHGLSLLGQVRLTA